jgi:signal peptidase
MDEKQKSTTKKVLSISLNSLFYLIIILLLIFSLANIKVKKENDIANIFGTGFLSVQSNSMFGDQEDSFEQGDMIFVKMLDEESVKELKVGDIVTYFDMSIKEFNTHRIVEINLAEEYLITQADYNYIGQNTNTQPDQPIGFDQALATYSTKISGLGNTLDYIQSPTGFALFVILPVVIILAFEGFILGRNILQVNRAKMEEKYAHEKEDQKALLESEKEKIRQEILAELNNNKNTDEKSE